MKRTSKITISALGLVSIFGIGYAAGAILYMSAVASYFRGVENGNQ